MSIKDQKQITGYILSFFLFVALLNSGYFFMATLKLSPGKWLAFNACSLAIIVYLVCFVMYRITKIDWLLAFPLLPLYYYGTMGLFIMPWTGANLFAQVTHILITLNVLWILFVLLKEQRFSGLGKGCLAGILVFVPVFAIVQTYTQLHMSEFLLLMQRM